MSKLTKEEYYANAIEIYDFFLSVRFSPAQAAGMVANVDAECSLDPTLEGDGNEAVGPFQMHADRIKLICNGNKQFPGCGVLITPTTKLSASLNAVWWELRHSERHALHEILSCHSAYDAGWAVAMYYERVGAKGQHRKRAKGAEKWLKWFSDNSNTVTANSSANNATSNNTTAFAASVHEDTEMDDAEMFKNSKMAKANNTNKDTASTANTDTADNTNHNISNVNYFDPELAKEPDETTYLDTPGTSNTMWLDRDLKEEDVDDVRVSDTVTVYTATSLVSANTLMHYANSHVSNTIPMNSNRTRGVDDEREDDFTTDLSNKSEETIKADAIANGRTAAEEVSKKEDERHLAGGEEKENDHEEDKEEASKEAAKQIAKDKKYNKKKAKEVAADKKKEEDSKPKEKETLSDKADSENDKQNHNVFREYYSNNAPEQSSNTVGTSTEDNVQA